MRAINLSQTVITDNPYQSLSSYSGVFTSNLQTVSFLGNYNTSGFAQDVIVLGNYAYVADDSAGLQILDISNPQQPTLLSNFTYASSSNDYIWGLNIIGNYAYLASGAVDAPELQIVDISDPEAPFFVGGFQDDFGSSFLASDLSVVGNTAYVADFGGLTILDLSNPATPTLLGNYYTNGVAVDVEVTGNYAYLLDNPGGLTILDVSNPENPTFLGNYGTSGSPTGITIAGNRAYIAEGEAGVTILDVSDPENPTFLGNYDTSGFAHEINLVGNNAYVADGESGLLILDVSNPQTPILLDSYDTSGSAVGLTIVDNIAYVADGTSGVSLIDISQYVNPPQPTIAVGQTAITFGTPLGNYRSNGVNSNLVRPNFADTSKYIDITNTAVDTNDVLAINNIEVKATNVTINADFSQGDILLNPGETRRFLLTYTPQAARENFNLLDGLIIHSNAVNDNSLDIQLTGRSTFNSDISYNGKVDRGDLAPLIPAYNSSIGSSKYDPSADINADGIINILDWQVFNTEYGQSLN